MHWYGRPGAYRTLKSDAPRLPRCGRRGAYPDIGEQLFYSEPMGAPVDRKDDPDEGRRRRGHRLADARSRAAPPPSRQPPLRNPVPPTNR
ncbi:hypothetical protein EVAR_91780_1 [Eumeta japonica]|uniref:Uncharacterized protein n=1 Tax=Eumeta variegata TaxID=151549 RepID=A0A4C1SUF7_EUMVA|nr:hypothetical protein EVAR_91780_1 [Eumeta japonica]